MTNKDRVALAFKNNPELSTFLHRKLLLSSFDDVLEDLSTCYEINQGQKHDDRWEVYKVTRLIDGKKFLIGTEVEGYGKVTRMIEVDAKLYMYLELEGMTATYGIDQLP